MSRIDPGARALRRRRPLAGGLPLCLSLCLALGLPAAVPAAGPEASAPAPATAPAPVIEVRETTQDGGTVEQGTLVKYRFTVANMGQADLELTQVKPSCGCTVPKWDKVIAPGKEGVIEAEVNTTAFRGGIVKHLTVSSNDPERPHLQLTVTAKVTPLIEVKPGLTVRLSVEDQPVTQELTLERIGSKPMQILGVTPNQPYLKTEVTALPGEGRYKLTLTATPDTPLGRTTIALVVRTDVPKGENLFVVLLLDRGIVTSPPGLYLGLTAEKYEAPRQIGMVVLSRQKGPFHVTGATVDDPKLEARLETRREGQEYFVRLNYAGGWDVGQVRKTLTVTTDDPKQPEIKVPITVTVQKADTRAAAAAH